MFLFKRINISKNNRVIRYSLRNAVDNTGFSLIEIAVVLFIISVGLVGILALITQNIQTESVNRNRLIASQLAQEGLALTKNIRGDNWLAGDHWSKGIEDADCSNCPDFEISFVIDHKGNKKMVSDIDEARLQTDGDGYYVHDDTYSDSRFKRMVTITSSSTASSSVSTKVKWTERDQVHTYVADTVLYNWR